jgi:hypothetical protein
MDFDDLLDEFSSNSKSMKTNTTQSRPNRPNSNEIDDFLEELKGIEKPEPMRQSAISRKPEEKKKTLQKCYPTYLSGNARGGYCSSSANVSACDKLRCTRCDLPVKRFLNKIWKGEAEYLFFRNNFSRDDKLAEMMIEASGSSAYNCQCLWRSVAEHLSVNGESWVCGGHLV